MGTVGEVDWACVRVGVRARDLLLLVRSGAFASAQCARQLERNRDLIKSRSKLIAIAVVRVYYPPKTELSE